MHLRTLLSSALTFQSLFSATNARECKIPDGVDLLSISVESLGQYLNNGSLTSVDLVRALLDRIDKDNHRGLNLRAVIETAPLYSVLDIAGGLDKERMEGKVRGPFHGIPVLIKDNCATDVQLGMNTTAGSYALLGSQVPRDSHIVSLLRDAGAIILGKSSLSEWANYRGGNQNGWSGRGGQTSSAYVVGGFAAGGDPCGSSSGSGVGVSAGFAPIAIGTETDGSIICPSNRAALFGLKPTVGLTSRAGIVPISGTQDSPGPMGRSAWDVAAMLTIIAGFDARDNATFASMNKTSDYTTAIVPMGFKGLRIGVPRSYFYNSNATGLEDEVYTTTNAVLAKIAALGATIQDPADLPSAPDFMNGNVGGNESFILNADFKVDLATYFAGLTNSTVMSLADVINFNDKNAAVEMPVGQCCQEIFIDAVQSTGLDTAAYKAARGYSVEFGDTNGMGAVFDKYNLDAIAIPSEVATTPAAIVGWPIATVPIGYFGANSSKTGQPYGLAFIARPFQERTLIRIMGAFEESFEKRKVPAQLDY